MATFTLTWTPVITGNVTAQRASYRQKSVGGAFLTTGFSPSNDLSTAATTTDHGSLTDNTIYEFKISNICTTGGPTDNTNGIIEQIVFACIAPTLSQTTTTATAAYTGLPSDITKVRFTLRKTSDNSLVSGPTTVTVVGGAASVTPTGLTPTTSYYFQTEFYTVINGVEVISSGAAYLNAVCGPYTVTTDTPASCPAPDSLAVTGSAV